MAALRRSWRSVVALAALIVLPGTLAGAGAAGACWAALRTPRRRRRQAALLVALAGALLLPAAPELLAPRWPGHQGLTWSGLAAALLIQASLGPAWLLIALPRAVPGSARGWVGTTSGEPGDADASSGILLGRQEGSDRPFRLRLPGDLSHHVTLLGVTGAGKTTTAERIASGVLDHGWPVLVVDAKGGGLRESARRLAAAHGVPHAELVPGDERSLHYNPCRVGSPAQIADKMVGAFSFSAEAEIFRNIAQETLAVITAALRLLERAVSVRALRDHLGEEGLNRLSVELRELDPQLATELRQLAKRRGIGAAGYEGMRARLGVLLQGMFGPLFEPGDQELDLEVATGRRGVTYVSVPAMAAQADSVLFAKVLVQDLKQLAHERRAGAIRRPRPGGRRRVRRARRAPADRGSLPPGEERPAGPGGVDAASARPGSRGLAVAQAAARQRDAHQPPDLVRGCRGRGRRLRHPAGPDHHPPARPPGRSGPGQPAGR